MTAFPSVTTSAFLAAVALGLALAGGTASAQEGFKPGETFRDCDECPEMMVLAGGVFAMGSERINEKEQPVHLVAIPAPFAIGRYEVTWDEWEACAEAGG